ncbi:MAG TPA: hypothetical protein VEW93_12145 [Acidimicrobiales bacterium]|nr:hypothetical protein [Acidimicrobiales bacterium]
MEAAVAVEPGVDAGGRDESTEFLLQSLRDLDREREAGDIDEDDYAALRDDYTARAAAALRAEQRGQAPPVPPSRPRSWLQRSLVLLGVVGFAVLSGVLVAQAVGRRDQGQGVTGEVTSSPTQEASRCIGLTAQGEYVDALSCYQEVLDDDPDNVVARTYLGWTLVLTARQAGDALSGDQLTELYVQARTQLDRAVEVDPRYADARAFQVILAVWEGRFEEAQRQLALFDELDAPADVQRQVDSQRQAIADGLATEAGGGGATEGPGDAPEGTDDGPSGGAGTTEPTPGSDESPPP